MSKNVLRNKNVTNLLWGIQLCFVNYYNQADSCSINFILECRTSQMLHFKPGCVDLTAIFYLGLRLSCNQKHEIAYFIVKSYFSFCNKNVFLCSAFMFLQHLHENTLKVETNSCYRVYVSVTTCMHACVNMATAMVTQWYMAHNGVRYTPLCFKSREVSWLNINVQRYSEALSNKQQHYS